MNSVVVVAAKRTPIGRFGGSMKNLSAVEMTSQLVKKTLEPLKLKDYVEEVILGNVLQSGQGQGPARQVQIYSGIDETVPSFTVNQICGSGMTSIILGAQKILTGERETVLVGGMESMSQAPYLQKKTRFGSKLGHDLLVDAILNDALTDSFSGSHMGVTAEKVAGEFEISRNQQDEFALESHQKVRNAWRNHAFSQEIIPMELSNGKIFDKDEHYREDLSLADLNKLRPAFQKEKGTVTAGNSSGINDGAAILLLMSKKKAEELGIDYLAEIISWASEGVNPEVMGLGPIPASRKALNNAGLDIDDIDLFEMNEAFAAQALAVKNELKIPEEKLNINGGAIALGHPVGASGARIVVSLVHALIKEEKKYGLASLCVGGGMGISIIIKREEV